MVNLANYDTSFWRRLPGGKQRVLATGSAPGGPSYWIATDRGGRLGSLTLSVGVTRPGASSPEEYGGGSFSPEDRRRLLSYQGIAGCTPRRYIILFGLLAKPGASVFARLKGVLVPFHRAGLPADVQQSGMLVYLSVSEMPSQILAGASLRKARPVEGLLAPDWSRCRSGSSISMGTI